MSTAVRSILEFYLEVFTEGGGVAPDHAAGAGFAIDQLARLPPEVYGRILEELDRAETLGPLLDPSAWTDGRRVENARLIRRVIEACRDLAEAERARREGWVNSVDPEVTP